MYMAELGFYLRRARKARDLTQSALAARAGISRETVSQLESGMAKDLGFIKVVRLLSVVGLDLRTLEISSPQATDYVALAASAGSTGFREALAPEELLRSLLSGTPPARKSPHLRRLLEDAAPALVAGLVSQVSQWAPPEKVKRNLLVLARKLDVAPRQEWTRTG